jgi:hypothetical protein
MHGPGMTMHITFICVVCISDNILTFIISSNISKCIYARQSSDALVEFDNMLGTLQRRLASNEP